MTIVRSKISTRFKESGFLFPVRAHLNGKRRLPSMLFPWSLDNPGTDLKIVFGDKVGQDLPQENL